MTQQDKDRAAFEAACAQWKEDAGHESRLSFASDEDGFLDRKVQALMGFWQAAIAHDRQQHEVIAEHSGCGYGTQVDQIIVRIDRGDKIVKIKGVG